MDPNTYTRAVEALTEALWLGAISPDEVQARHDARHIIGYLQLEGLEFVEIDYGKEPDL